jgi:glutamine amidotransferase
MKRIVIVDYGLGNLFSIKQALEAAGASVYFSLKAEEILKADGILLPGVGAFADAMKRLNELKLVDVIVESAQKNKPILGVCLGLQLLFEKSYEFGEHKGLGLIPGEVVKFPSQHNGVPLTVPFIGWNKLHLTEAGKDSSILSSLADLTKIYFVHSYYVSPKSEA